MDTNDATKQPKKKTEDYFPGASSAWSNAWCMDFQSFTTPEDERPTEYRDHEDPETGLDTAKT